MKDDDWLIPHLLSLILYPLSLIPYPSMMFLFLLAVLAATAAALWFQGLWNAAVTLVNLILAMAIAPSFYEPICTQLEKISGDVKQLTYLLDFIVLWVLFA